jgi:hypothetical protein
LMHKPQLTEPPDADPHVRWCGRGTAGILRLPPIPITKHALCLQGSGAPDVARPPMALDE